MMTVPPAGMVGAATATIEARARGVQHLYNILATPPLQGSATPRHPPWALSSPTTR